MDFVGQDLVQLRSVFWGQIHAKKRPKKKKTHLGEIKVYQQQQQRTLFAWQEFLFQFWEGICVSSRIVSAILVPDWVPLRQA